MNRHQMIHQAIKLGKEIKNEKNELEKIKKIVQKGQIECQLGIHNL